MEKLQPLSAEARSLIQQAHGFDEPTATDRERVKGKWMAAVAAGGGISVAHQLAEATSTQAVAGAGKAGLASQWALWAGAGVAALAAGAGLWAAVSAPEPQPAASASVQLSVDDFTGAPAVAVPQPPPRAPLAEALREPSSGESSTLEATAPQPREPEASPAVASSRTPSRTPGSRPAKRVRSQQPPALAVEAAPSPGASNAPSAESEAASEVETSASGTVEVDTGIADGVASPGGSLRREIQLLKSARELLARGKSRATLGMLDQYGRLFAAPVLASEASALRVDALCASGQQQAARAEAERFRSNWPDSPLAQRVAQACSR